MKKVLSLFLSLCILTFLFPMLSVTATDGGAYTEEGFTYTVTDGEATIISYKSSNSGELVIPSTLGGYPVVTIGDEAFFNCTNITSVTFPDTLTTIGGSAFFYCRFPTITIPANVTFIADNALAGCMDLTAIYVDENNPHYCSVDGVLFDKSKSTLMQYPPAKAMTIYELPNGVTSIRPHVFFFCTQLTSIILPDTLTYIGEGAFNCCMALSSLVIPDGVTIIEDYAFDHCMSLDSITIPKSVTSIGANAFVGCNSLSNVYYMGSEENWNKVFNDSHDTLSHATIHYTELSPSVIGTLSNGTLNITPENVPTGSRISYAAFQGNKMVSFDTFLYNGTSEDFPITADYDYIKIFAWDGLEPLMNPITVH